LAKRKTDVKEVVYVGVDRAGLIWLTSGKFTDTLFFGFRKIISFNSENVATFCDSYSNSSSASSEKLMLTIQTSISLQIAAPQETPRVSLGDGLIASYQSSQSDEVAWTAILQPLLYS
jgi:hypothetical protein